MFGNRLLQIMKEEDISVRGLSRMSGVSINRITDILAGIREPDIRTANRLADALGMKISDFTEDGEQAWSITDFVLKQGITLYGYAI